MQNVNNFANYTRENIFYFCRFILFITSILCYGFFINHKFNVTFETIAVSSPFGINQYVIEEVYFVSFNFAPQY